MIDHLVEHPSLGHNGRVSNTRELIIPITPYIVAYELSTDFVDILAIIHSSRRWPEKFN
jgi:plasmid stabilization system protein ParE